jgi:hypothetical protein
MVLSFLFDVGILDGCLLTLMAGLAAVLRLQVTGCGLASYRLYDKARCW